jgi:thiamine-monophosphate kinase
MNLKDIGEFGFIDRVAPIGITRPTRVVKGIGDDCAVMAFDAERYLLVTTDLLVERVHFLIEWGTPEMIGAKSIAIQLSDIAACGGRPLDAFVSLAIPDRVSVEWLDGFYRGITDVARAYQVNVLGGDTTSSKTDLIMNVTVTGQVAPHEILYRHTANAGDVIALTGKIGESAAGCHILLNSVQLPEDIAQPLISTHLSPRPHVKEGRLLAASGACTAAIDVSDGLSSDLGHLCTESRLGAIIREDDLPESEVLVVAASRMGKDPLRWMLNGGEDYVLLAAIKPDMLRSLRARMREQGCALYPIGEFVDGTSMILRKSDGQEVPLEAGGWDHFKNSHS